MGVPKFYRWLSERYPLINQVVDPTFKPEFDNLYLDMNGVVHWATHSEDLDPSAPFSMDDAMARMFRYLDNLIRLARPKKVVYMALDGVAPRAKMNQQRQRRFRSAQDAALLREELIAKGMDPSTPSFDSNAITPGTEFMASLTPHLHYFIRKKVSEDPLWKGLEVVFSGHEVPGEGEHKIMDYIRSLKMQPGYDPNTAHCIYGLDADLIFLSLVLHEPHTALLREEVVFGNPRRGAKQARQPFAKDSRFQLLHISILREYWALEFEGLELERVIDDLVLLCFMTGNDFLPHIPSMDIGEGGLNTLFELYKEQLGGTSASASARASASASGENKYLTDGKGGIFFEQLLPLFSRLGELESGVFVERAATILKEQRRGRGRGGNSNSNSNSNNSRHIPVPIQVSEDDSSSDSSSEKEKEKEEKLFQQFQSMELSQSQSQHSHSRPVDPYYTKKWGPLTLSHLSPSTPPPPNSIQSLVLDYLTGMYWVLQYYYQGVQSWAWFFPHFYAPLASDLALYTTPELTSTIPQLLELGSPFTPVQQLMSVLPPASSQLVPMAALRTLMTSPTSPIASFYPKTFEIDMNDKRNPWEGIVLIPFVDEKRLREALVPLQRELHALPSHQRGMDYSFTYSTDLEVYTHPSTIPSLFPSINNCKIQCIPYLNPSASASANAYHSFLCKAMIPFFATFPLLEALPPSKTVLDPKAGVNLFGRPSAKESVILHLDDLLFHSCASSQSSQGEELPTFRNLIQQYLGRIVYIDWPFYRQAVVDKLTCEYFSACIEKAEYKLLPFGEQERRQWQSAQDDIRRTLACSKGIQLSKDKCRVLFHVRRLDHLEPLSGTGGFIRKWAEEVEVVPSQLCLGYDKVPFDARFVDQQELSFDAKRSFPLGSQVLLSSVVASKGIPLALAQVGEVLSYTSDNVLEIRFNDETRTIPHDFCRQIVSSSPSCRFVQLHRMAKQLSLKPIVLSKLLSSVFFDPGYRNLGLSLKFKKRGEMVGGLVRLVSPSRGDYDDYEYSQEVVDLLREYKKKYPLVFEAVSRDPNAKKYDASVLLPASSSGSNSKNKRQLAEDTLNAVFSWIKSLPMSSLPLVPKTSSVLSPQQISVIESRISSLTCSSSSSSPSPSQHIKAQLLYSEIQPLNTQWSPSPQNKFNLGDRVAYLGGEAGIPFGMQGTVVGVHPLSEQFDTPAVDVVFDYSVICGTSLSSRCSPTRGVVLRTRCLFNITYGVKMDKASKGRGKGKGNSNSKEVLQPRKQKEVVLAPIREPMTAYQPSYQSVAGTSSTGSAGSINSINTNAGKEALPGQSEYEQYAHLWNDLGDNKGVSNGIGKGMGKGEVNDLVSGALNAHAHQSKSGKGTKTKIKSKDSAKGSTDTGRDNVSQSRGKGRGRGRGRGKRGGKQPNTSS